MNKYKLNDNDIISGSSRYVLRIKDLEESDKPREKLSKLGVSSLSLPELFAILLSPGNRREGVLEIANRIISDYGPIPNWTKQGVHQVAKELDITPNKACQLIAALEIGQRLFLRDKSKSLLIRTPDQAFSHLKDMGSLQKENFRGLYLNSRYMLIHDEIISVGSISSSLVHPREVFRPALERGASAVIIAHNHPSGSLKATKDDLMITEQLRSAGEILGIELLDHLIIGQTKYISLIKHEKI